jgi:transcriptional regulator with XRE-family HTH domain
LTGTVLAHSIAVQSIADVFADTLRRLRHGAGISQKQLAALSGLSASFIAHMEMGRKPPNIVALVRMAHALRVPVGALVEDLDAPAAPPPPPAPATGVQRRPTRKRAAVKALSRR